MQPIECYPIPPSSQSYRADVVQFSSKEKLFKFLEKHEGLQTYRYFFKPDVIDAIAEEYAGKTIARTDLDSEVSNTLVHLIKEEKIKFAIGLPQHHQYDLLSMALRKALKESTKPWEKFKENVRDALWDAREALLENNLLQHAPFLGVSNHPANDLAYIPVPDSLHHNFFPEEKLLHGLKSDPRTTSLNPKLLKLIAECLGGEERVNDDFLSVFAKKAMEKVLSSEELNLVEEEKVIHDITEVLRDNAHSHCDAVPLPSPIQKTGNFLDVESDFLDAEIRKEDSLVKELEQNQLLPSEKVVPDLEKFLDHHEEKAVVVKKVVESSTNNVQIATEAMRVAAHIAKEIHELIQKNDQRKVERSRYRELYRDYIRTRKKQDRELKSEEIRSTYANLEQIRQHLFQRFSPKGIVELFEEARLLSEKYKREMDEIERDLKINAGIQSAIGQAQSLNDALAASDHKRWKRALRIQQRVAQEFGLMRAIFGIAGVTLGAAATLIPGGQVAGLALAAQGAHVFASGAQFAERSADRRGAVMNANYQKRVAASSSRADELYMAASVAQDQAFQLRQKQFQNQEVLLMYGSVFDAKTYTKSLQESEALQKHNLAAAQGRMESAQRQFEHYSKAAADDEGRIKAAEAKELENGKKAERKNKPIASTWNYSPVMVQKPKKVKVDGCTKEELENNRVGNLAKAANASVEIEAQKREIAILSESLGETRKEASYQMSIQPYRKLQDELYQKKGYIKVDQNGNRVSNLTPEQAAAKDKREAFADTLQKAIEVEELEHRLQTEGLRVAQQYAYFMQSFGWNVPMQAVSAAHDAHELHKGHAVWGQIRRAVDTFKEDHKKDSYKDTLMALHQATPGEASQAVKLALLGAEHLLVGVRLAFALGSLLHRSFLFLNGQSGHKSEREILLQHLQGALKFLHHVLSAQMDSLGDQLDQNTRECCRAIYSQGEEIIREIDSGKFEILAKVDGGAYNRQLQKQLKLLNKLKPSQELLKEVLAPENAGILPGFSPRHEGTALYPAIEPMLAYRNPEHFPELLFAQFGLQDSIPNIALLAAYAENLERSETNRQAIDSLKAAHIRFEKAIEHIGEAFDKLAIRKGDFFKIGAERLLAVQTLKRQLQNQSIERAKQSLPPLEVSVGKINPVSHSVAASATAMVAKPVFNFMKEVALDAPLWVTVVVGTPIVLFGVLNYAIFESVTSGIILGEDAKQLQRWRINSVKNRCRNLVVESPKNGAIPIHSLQQNGRPLPLPTKLLDELKGQLDQELHRLETLGMGTLVPRYSFSEKGGKWCLQLHYHFCSLQGASSPFCHINLASFSFNELNGRDPEEFLLEKLYSQKGLFDEGFDLSQGMQIELGYLKVMHDATVKARELSKQAASYREGYFVLYGLVKMISSLSNEQFFKAMEDCGLPHPDLLVQQALEGNSPQEVTAPFTELLLKNPSPLLQRLREVMGKLTQ